MDDKSTNISKLSNPFSLERVYNSLIRRDLRQNMK